MDGPHVNKNAGFYRRFFVFQIYMETKVGYAINSTYNNCVSMIEAHEV